MPSTPRRPDPEVDLRQCVEGGDGISVIRGVGNCRSWNNIQYRVGLSSKNVGASKLSMNVATIPPGGVSYIDARATAVGATTGSVDIAYDGEPDALVGSQTTLSATTGLSFDTVTMHRIRR